MSEKRCAATRNGYNWKGSEAILPSILHEQLFPEAMEVTSERTLLMVKPDGVRRSLVGLIITRIEQKGLVISNMRMFRMDDAFARTFYAEHDGRDFFPALLSFMTSGPVVALQIESPNAIALVRTAIGATRPEDRLPGTIRSGLLHSTDRECSTCVRIPDRCRTRVSTCLWGLSRNSRHWT